MPWQEATTMSERLAFCREVEAATEPMRALCRCYRISPTTGYAWFARYEAEGEAGLADRSRRPRSSPRRTDRATEAAVVALRDAQPHWGGRTLRARLLALGHDPVPSPSTVTAILRRHDRLAAPAPPPPPWQRFEADAPNALWQMDFKGPVRLTSGTTHPLLVLDDHARFALAVTALPDQRTATVQARLTGLFRAYGLPDRILCDNGAPWGSSQPLARLTRLSAWLLRLGVRVSHGRPYHPETQGKVERFGRTLETELLAGRTFADPVAFQMACDAWRGVYNDERPHHALGLTPPAGRYHASARPFPETLPTIAHPDGATLLRVCSQGYVRIAGGRHYVSEVIPTQLVAVVPTDTPDRVAIAYGPLVLRHLDLRAPGPGVDPRPRRPLP